MHRYLSHSKRHTALFSILLGWLALSPPNGLAQSASTYEAVTLRNEVVRMRLERVPVSLRANLDRCALERREDGFHAILILNAEELSTLRMSGVEFVHLEGVGFEPLSPLPRNTLQRKRVPSLEPRSASRLSTAGLETPEAQSAEDAELSEASICAGIGTSLEPYDEYHRLSESMCFLENLAEAHPEITELVDLGPTVEGRRITAIKIANRRRSPDAEVEKILFTGVTHAREWITHEIVLYIAEYLTERYATDRAVRRIVDRSEIWLIPVVNPDGFEYSWDVQRFWRKNRAFTGTPVCRGVDLNRNFSANWNLGRVGGSPIPCHHTYRGPGPASEPETQAIEELLLRERFAISVNYHSFGNQILYPWASRQGQIAESDTSFRAIARRYTDEVQAVHGLELVPGTLGDVLYLASGTIDEYAYEVAGTLSFTPEVRPRTWEEGGFSPSEDLIRPAAEENLAAALWLMKNVAGAREVRPERGWRRARHPEGIATFSLPMTPVNQKPEILYGEESFFHERLLRWVDDPQHVPADLGEYARDFEAMSSGRGYYLDLSGIAHEDVPALRSYKALPYLFDDGAEVALSNRAPGLNIVGIPFAGPLPLAELRIVKRVACTLGDEPEASDCRYGEQVLEERTALEDLSAAQPWIDWRWRTIDRRGRPAFVHPTGADGASHLLRPFRAYEVEVRVASWDFGSESVPVYALRFPPRRDHPHSRVRPPLHHLHHFLRHLMRRWLPKSQQRSALVHESKGREAQAVW